MVTFNSTQCPNGKTAPKPEIEGLLPDVPGGEPGLLPVGLTGDNLKVWFTIPLYSAPPYGEEKYELFVDDRVDAITTRCWKEDILDSERYLELPKEWMNNNNGQHRLYYRTTIYNGAVNCSFDLVITLDTRAPVLATDSQLIFPAEVLPPNKLTAYYLEDNDQVEVAIPAYTTPKAYDVITWYWDRTSSGMTVGGTKVLTPQDFDKPLVLTIEGQWIRDSGDGDRFVWYTITDRAGNPPNGQSAVERLIVAAQPIPRVLPPPKVVEASGITWPVRGTLDPTNATNGVTVLLKPESVIYPDEIPQVQWATKGELGSYLADPVSSDKWEYKIPKEYMAAHFGKAIPVVYFFNDKHGKPHNSETYTLTVLNYPGDRLPPPQCAEGSPLSLTVIPSEGASITLNKWPFSAVGQRVTIIVEGIEDATGGTIKCQVLDQHSVTSEQATAGITKGQALVEKAGFLSRIRLGSSLTVKAYVSFDNGKTWNGRPTLNPAQQQFPWLKPMLIA